jgi:hypothetical protein
MRAGSPFATRPVFMGAPLLFCFCASILWSAPEVGYAQATATFYETVTDPSGAAVPGASVMLTEQDTQAAMTTVTGTDGDFSLTFIPPGIYTLKIEAKGFKTHSSTGIL